MTLAMHTLTARDERQQKGPIGWETEPEASDVLRPSLFMELRI